MTDWTLHTARIEAVVSSLGAMMAPVWFTLPDGNRIQPFKVAGWADRAEAAGFPPVMRFLKGDFACVPYGAPAPSPALPQRWTDLFTAHPAFTETHGVCANHDWSIVTQKDSELLIAIDYPDSHPVARVEKRVTLDDADLAVVVELTIHAREKVRIACGVHPVFDIGDDTESAIVEARFGFGRTFPGEYVPGVSRFAPDQRFVHLSEVPCVDGTSVNAGRLPLASPSDEVIQLCDSNGIVTLRRPGAGYAVELSWAAEQWPSCLLWIASGGRTTAPFDGRFRALAIEPAAASFGIGSTISANQDNPIAQEGVRTWIDLEPETPWMTRYRFVVRAEAATDAGNQEDI